MQHIKRDHEDYLLYEFKVTPIQGKVAGLLLTDMDFDPPLPVVLLDRPDWQIEVGGYRIGLQDWQVSTDLEEGNIVRMALTYTGNVPQRYPPNPRVAVRIRKPNSPGEYFAISPGPTRDHLKQDCLREEPPDEIECPNCEAELYPVPDKCPQCGEVLNPDTPTVGELVDKYGRDAVVDVYVSNMSADLIINFTRTKKQADEANKKKRKAHDEKAALYKKQIEAWKLMLAPETDQKKREQKARELAELERLKSKYESDTAG